MKKVVILLISIFLIYLISCGFKDEKLTVQNVEIFKNTPAWELAKALEKGNFKKANAAILVNKDLINYQEPHFGTTLLMRQVSNENYKSVQFLLQKGANPNIISKLGSTALFDAVSHSWSDIMANEDPKYVQILLENGADPNITYCAPKVAGSVSPIECGTSPLMHAATRGLEKSKLLLDAGAELNYKTKLGTTAAVEALMMQKVDVAHYLIVMNKAKVNEPFYYYYLDDDSKINMEKPHLPIAILENWLFDLGSKKHKLKMEIVAEFKRQGQDYWSIEKHPTTVERIKSIYPNTWEKYLKEY